MQDRVRHLTSSLFVYVELLIHQTAYYSALLFVILLSKKQQKECYMLGNCAVIVSYGRFSQFSNIYFLLCGPYFLLLISFNEMLALGSFLSKIL